MCPAGKVVLGGGAILGDTDPPIDLVESRPVSVDGSFGWAVAVRNFVFVSNTVRAYAICAMADGAAGSATLAVPTIRTAKDG